MNKIPAHLPGAFEEQMSNMLGNQYRSFHAALETAPPVSIRINQMKPSLVASGSPVPWCESGRYLANRPVFTLDPHFHAGAYYVQEASSMFLEQAVRQSIDPGQPVTALDLCAAPGGKSTHLLSLLHKDSLVVSNEVIRSRAAILSENIQKWGYSNVMVTNNDPSAFAELHGFFDLIVIDAPCSGEGLFRKDPAAISEWSKDSVALCSSRQRRIVEDAWPSLKHNGLLIYCTCTYNETENEDNLAWLSEQHDLEFVKISAQYSGVHEVNKGAVTGYRFFPHRVQGEGFFISVIRKLEDTAATTTKRRGRSDRSASSASQHWLNGHYSILERGDLLIAVPGSIVSQMETLSQQLNVVIQGVALGTNKHGKFIPDHALAMSTDLRKSEFEVIELTKDESLRYLRKDTLSRPGHPRGLALVQFECNPLGWINVLDNRINNLYPSNWRIKNL